MLVEQPIWSNNDTAMVLQTVCSTMSVWDHDQPRNILPIFPHQWFAHPSQQWLFSCVYEHPKAHWREGEHHHKDACSPYSPRTNCSAYWCELVFGVPCAWELPGKWWNIQNSQCTFLSWMATTYNWGWYQCKYTSGCHILISESQYPVHTRALTIPLWFLVRWASSPPPWVSQSWCLYFNNLVGITKCWTYLEEGACIPDYVNLVTNLQIL